jgi:hypothetical protein
MTAPNGACPSVSFSLAWLGPSTQEFFRSLPIIGCADYCRLLNLQQICSKASRVGCGGAAGMRLGSVSPAQPRRPNLIVVHTVTVLHAQLVSLRQKQRRPPGAQPACGVASQFRLLRRRGMPWDGRLRN